LSKNIPENKLTVAAHQVITTNDPTRPWVSSDGEDDGEGILPVTGGHYGDINSRKQMLRNTVCPAIR
jgi:beta-galactosidase